MQQLLTGCMNGSVGVLVSAALHIAQQLRVAAGFPGEVRECLSRN